MRSNRGDNNTDNGNTDVAHAAAATSVTISGLSFVNTSISAPDLSYNKLVSFQLKDMNENSDYPLVLQLLEGNLNGDSFEE